MEAAGETGSATTSGTSRAGTTLPPEQQAQGESMRRPRPSPSSSRSQQLPPPPRPKRGRPPGSKTQARVRAEDLKPLWQGIGRILALGGAPELEDEELQALCAATVPCANKWSKSFAWAEEAALATVALTIMAPRFILVRRQARNEREADERAQQAAEAIDVTGRVVA